MPLNGHDQFAFTIILQTRRFCIYRCINTQRLLPVVWQLICLCIVALICNVCCLRFGNLVVHLLLHCNATCVACCLATYLFFMLVSMPLLLATSLCVVGFARCSAMILYTTIALLLFFCCNSFPNTWPAYYKCCVIISPL
jgi:hypothetical protein